MKKITRILLCFFVIIAILIIINGIYCTNTIETKYYTFKSEKIDTTTKFIFISDLHNKEFGEKNSEIVSKIREQDPDFIAVGGDMVTRTKTEDRVMKEILPQLVEIAPTYCVLGNHELDLSDHIDFRTDIESCGATLLDNEHNVFTTESGENILIIGMTGYPYPYTDERDFWNELQSSEKLLTEYYSLLLIHSPDYLNGLLPDSGIDLTMCGHTHGGLVQIPFIGGLIAPNQWFFPEFDLGKYQFGESTMIISAGLGISYPVPRINNPAEITVIEIS